MTTEEKLEKAMDLLSRAGEFIESDNPPDWWKDYFILTGDHMICTEEGWEPGEIKAETVKEYGADYILDEVNAPDGR